MQQPTKTIAPLRFDDLDGHQFERLVFAYFVRTEPTYAFEWYGQAGKDRGRDIVGHGRAQENAGRTLLIACANWKDFTAAKAKSDLNTCVGSSLGTPDHVKFVTGSQTITASIRDDIRSHCATMGIFDCDIWSGPELEENLRAKTESLLRRLFEGVDFPDDIEELIQFCRTTPPSNDREVINALSRALDRPAFQDRIHQESSLPAFHQAIEDAICVINTGVWKTRDGAVIAHLPSKHIVANPEVRAALDDTVAHLRELRAFFDVAMRRGQIQPCGYRNPDCPTYMMDWKTASELEGLRSMALDKFRMAQRLADPTGL